MYNIQPQEEEVMKKGGKVKAKAKQKQKQKQSVNIRNIITINRGGVRVKGKTAPKAPKPQQQYQAPAVQFPFINLLRPQSNEPRSVSITGATAGEANNNVLDTIRKSQEITEGRLNARIDDMGSQILQDFNQALRGGIDDFRVQQKVVQQKVEQKEQKVEQKEQKEPIRVDLQTDYLKRKEARLRERAQPPI